MKYNNLTHSPRQLLTGTLGIPLTITIPLLAQTEKNITKPNIKLVLQITVDGLRGDLLNRYTKQLGRGGFAYLFKQGTSYSNAHYQHANTETIVDHATLATGSFPRDHGMAGKSWSLLNAPDTYLKPPAASRGLPLVEVVE